MPNPNLELLELAAERLRQLLPEIVFVGGCATGLLIDDPAAAPVRGTYDVDVIAEIGSYAEYTVFSERLRGLGFKEDSREGAFAPMPTRHHSSPKRYWTQILLFQPTAIQNGHQTILASPISRDQFNLSFLFCWCREGGSNPHDLAIGGF
jgi:hypothetical protein